MKDAEIESIEYTHSPITTTKYQSSQFSYQPKDKKIWPKVVLKYKIPEEK